MVIVDSNKFKEYAIDSILQLFGKVKIILVLLNTLM